MRTRTGRSSESAIDRLAFRVSLLILALVAAPAESAGFHPSVVFRDPTLHQVMLSPNGDWVVALYSGGVEVLRRDDPDVHAVHRSPQPITTMAWVGPDSLLLSLDPMHLTMPRAATVLRLRTEGGKILAAEIPISRVGRLVRAVPGHDELVLWSRRVDGESVVDRASVEALAGPSRFEDMVDDAGNRFGRVTSVRRNVSHWVTDSGGELRAYFSIEWDGGEHYAIGYRANGSADWREIWRGRQREEEYMVPWGVTRDGRRLIVSAYAGRDTLGLHELDPESGELVRAIFVRPEVDVTGLVFGADGAELVGAAYFLGGRAHFEYFNEYTGQQIEGLSTRVRDEGLRITSSSSDGRHLTLLAQGPRNPGTFYYYATDSGRLTKLGDRTPGIDPDALVPGRAVEAVSRDGMRVEGFLFVPHTGGPEPPPLLVMPHGGPIGVADGGTFAPLVQYVAVSGIAVLQVNYRGSGGYGKDFLEAGYGEWGRGIEEDIDAVVQAVIDQGVVDGERMCIAGGSYGGFSALISAIQRPDRYDCAATINGVSDIPLMFQGSDWSMFQQAREEMIEYVGGDPVEDLEGLMALSPVYRVDELQVPVLIAHGSDDARVDIEHAHRLRAMLEAYGKPYEWLEVDGGEHDPTSGEWVRYATRLARFLQQHIGPTERHTPRH